MKILLPIDDSKFSQAATEMLIAHVKPAETEVCVVHVREPGTIGGESYVEDWKVVEQNLRNRAEALLGRTAEALRAAGFRTDTALEEGDAKSVIIEMAAKWPADLIIIGSHGRKGLSRFLMGSVAEAVVRHARCSVQVVRPQT